MKKTNTTVIRTTLVPMIFFMISFVIFFMVSFTVLFLPSSFAWDHCFTQAGNMYDINPYLLWAIAKVESNFNPHVVNYNSNGSYDYGVMQINSSWYRILGYERWMKLSDPCYNIHIGTWILKQCINRYGYTWEAVGCYNAKSKHKRNKYAWTVYRTLKSYENK